MSHVPFRPAFPRGFFAAGALAGAAGIVLGALDSHLPDSAFAIGKGRAAMHNAVEILMWHAIALCALSLGARHLSPRLGAAARLTMLAGTVLFCGAVTLYALWNPALGPLPVARIAPWGGTLLILAWCLAAASALAGPR